MLVSYAFESVLLIAKMSPPTTAAVTVATSHDFSMAQPQV